MNNINPLHITALLVAIIFFSLLKLSSAKDDLAEAKQSYKESEKLAVNVRSIKDVYADKNKVRKAIDRVLKQSSLKNANLEIKRSKTSIKIDAKKITTYSLNALMSKILNGSYNITQLKIKRVDKTHASLKLEIKW